MTLQRGAPIGWEAPGEDRRKVASEPGGERARRKGVDPDGQTLPVAVPDWSPLQGRKRPQAERPAVNKGGTAI